MALDFPSPPYDGEIYVDRWNEAKEKQLEEQTTTPDINS